MTRRIALEIFDDPERCERPGGGKCRYLCGWATDSWFPLECDHFNVMLDADAKGHALRCPECKAAEITEVSCG